MRPVAKQKRKPGAFARPREGRSGNGVAGELGDYGGRHRACGGVGGQRGAEQSDRRGDTAGGQVVFEFLQGAFRAHARSVFPQAQALAYDRERQISHVAREHRFAIFLGQPIQRVVEQGRDLPPIGFGPGRGEGGLRDRVGLAVSAALL
jgi:hypothetical protein